MMPLRYNTASQEIILGRFVDATDGNTAEPGLTIANTDIKLWKQGASTQVDKNSGGATHDAAGMYVATLDDTDTDTLGPLEINIQVAGARSVRREYTVYTQNYFDSLISGTDKLEVDLEGIATKEDLASHTSTTYFRPISGTIIVGDVDDGVWTNTHIRDNTYWTVGEVSGAGLTVEYVFNLDTAEQRPGVFETFGRYIGTPPGTHYMDLWAYNYESNGWELLQEGFMPGGNTSDDSYFGEYFERHIDADNNYEIKIRLIHHITSYSNSHAVYMDYVSISAIEVITAADIASAVWNKLKSDHQISGSFGEELATKADIQASASTEFFAAISATVIDGDVSSGVYTDTAVRDNILWIIDENVTDGLTVEFEFRLPDINYRAGTFQVFGHYDGKGSPHYLDLWAYNVETASWELVHEIFMSDKTTDESQIHSYFERHIDRANNHTVKVRIVHNVTTYTATHHLSMDAVHLSGINIITAADIASAVWDKLKADHNSAGSTGEVINNLPADPASETNVNANETKIDTVQTGIAALNDISVTDILSSLVDGKSVSHIFELVMAVVDGRFSKNGGVYTFYKRNNSTVLTTITVSDTERTRS